MSDIELKTDTPQTPSKLMPAIWGGLLIGFLAGIPFFAWINCACCIGVMAGGVLSVYLYKNELAEGSQLTMGDGAVLGLFAGIMGTVVAAILETIFGNVGIDLLYRFSNFLDIPELNYWLSEIDPKHFAKGIFALKLVTNLVTFVIFGLVGGILGVSIFNKKSKSL
jgi:hypothetical protein